MSARSSRNASPAQRAREAARKKREVEKTKAEKKKRLKEREEARRARHRAQIAKVKERARAQIERAKGQTASVRALVSRKAHDRDQAIERREKLEAARTQRAELQRANQQRAEVQRARDEEARQAQRERDAADRETQRVNRERDRFNERFERNEERQRREAQREAQRTAAQETARRAASEREATQRQEREHAERERVYNSPENRRFRAEAAARGERVVHALRNGTHLNTLTMDQLRDAAWHLHATGNMAGLNHVLRHVTARNIGAITAQAEHAARSGDHERAHRLMALARAGIQHGQNAAGRNQQQQWRIRQGIDHTQQNKAKMHHALQRGKRGGQFFISNGHKVYQHGHS